MEGSIAASMLLRMMVRTWGIVWAASLVDISSIDTSIDMIRLMDLAANVSTFDLLSCLLEG